MYRLARRDWVKLGRSPTLTSGRSQVLSIILAIVWLLRFYLPRHTVPPVGHAMPPFVNGKVNNHNDAFLGWMAGWAGTILYNVPRAHILYDSIKNKRPPPSEPWMFGALVGENLLTTVVSLREPCRRAQSIADAAALPERVFSSWRSMVATRVNSC